ncbi:MAG: tRNA (adenosine(37)-N6)-dimethylallyltransferase MiaA [Betaproteobacteria bacterium]|jgi:tRNA dimethylallyltransferase|nr:tRNA (adenosine(37)-N6)-dimethylallyltransferase MiaA [Betaproteobacteria bacterium]
MLCLLGPTASGKSSLAFWLAQEIPEIEIISMDSAQIYRGMDIGTAKPTADECAQVPHHLIDILDPAESYSAARFVNDARKAAEAIRARGGIPIIVGGTMLYFKALSEGLDDLPTVPAEIRSRIAEEARALGWPALHQQLADIDPETAQRLNPNDAQRISRALELYRFTGQSMAKLISQSVARGTRQSANKRLKVVGLQPEDRAWLHQRISSRFELMLAQGFLDEVRALFHRGDLHCGLPSMRCVGYRQAWDHLAGRASHDAFVSAAIAATRQLAKRQITWLRGFRDITRLDPRDQQQTARQLCKELILAD